MAYKNDTQDIHMLNNNNVIVGRLIPTDNKGGDGMVN